MQKRVIYQTPAPVFKDLNARSLATAIAPERIAISAIDRSFIGKSGKQTWGLEKFYSGTAGKSQTGLEISVISVVDVAAHQGYTLSVEQTAATVRLPSIANEQMQNPPEKRKGNQNQNQNRTPWFQRESRRQALNSHLLERFITLLELDQTLIKSHPNYENLIQYGSLTL